MVRLFLVLVFCSCSYAGGGFFAGHSDGWFWYQSQKANVSKKVLNKNPQQIIKSWQNKHKYLRAKAIVTQNPEDVARFIAWQNFLINHSERFANVFQHVIATHPEFDFERELPSSSVGHDAAVAKKERLELARIKAFAKDHGLFYFFDGRDEGSIVMAGIAQRFSEKHGFDLLVVAMNQQGVKAIPQARLDKGQAAALGVKYFPALISINPKTMATLPLAHGRVHALDELEFKLVGFLHRGRKQNV